jgi:hypothetical protein
MFILKQLNLTWIRTKKGTSQEGGYTGYFLGLLFDPDDRGNMFLPSVGEFLPDSTALYLRECHSCENVKSNTIKFCYKIKNSEEHDNERLCSIKGR